MPISVVLIGIKDLTDEKYVIVRRRSSGELKSKAYPDQGEGEKESKQDLTIVAVKTLLTFFLNKARF